MEDKAPHSEIEEFEDSANQQQTGLFMELFEFLIDRKKWWLVLIIIVFLGLTGLVVIGGTGAAPFIYTLF